MPRTGQGTVMTTILPSCQKQHNKQNMAIGALYCQELAPMIPWEMECQRCTLQGTQFSVYRKPPDLGVGVSAKAQVEPGKFLSWRDRAWERPRSKQHRTSRTPDKKAPAAHSTQHYVCRSGELQVLDLREPPESIRGEKILCSA